MGAKNTDHEIGYERLLAYFLDAQRQSPRGVSLKRNRNTINLKFCIGNNPKDRGCNCRFTYDGIANAFDGIANALEKSRKVAEALKRFNSETEFEQWYAREILERNVVKNDLKRFSEAIALVEVDYWRRRSRNKRKRDKNNPSDINSWNVTYASFVIPIQQLFISFFGGF